MKVYTDGSHSPAGSGWAAVCPDRQEAISGSLTAATNQQAELMAVLHAVHRFGSDITIVTDSAYVIGCFTEWLPNWKRNGWRTAAGKPVLNQDIIKMGIQAGCDKVKYVKVKSHSGDYYNELADRLAKESYLCHGELQRG